MSRNPWEDEERRIAALYEGDPENLPYDPWEATLDEHGEPDGPKYPRTPPGATWEEHRDWMRTKLAEHEARKSPQQRLRERKELEAFEGHVSDVFEAAFARLDAAFADPEEDR